jgi:hypothetical protein
MYFINKKNDSYIVVASVATLFTLAIIAASSMATPAAATTTTTTTATSNTTTSTNTTPSSSSSSSSGIELSPQPVYQRRPMTTGVTPVNQTYIHSTFSSNGTLTLPNTTETINTTSNGSALTSLTTQSAIAKETIMTEDGETATATFYEIVGLTTGGGGNGIAIAVLHTNSTDRLAPLNGMILVGTDYMQPLGNGLTTYWEWVPTPPTPSLPPTNMEESSPPSPMNTTTTTPTTNATTADTNATAAIGGGGQQQRCQLEITTNEETFEIGEPVTINVTNGGDEALEFPNSVLGLGIKNHDTGEAYPLFSAQVITTLEPGESRTFEFTYEELVSEIGTGTIDATVNGEECSAGTTFTLG